MSTADRARATAAKFSSAPTPAEPAEPAPARARPPTTRADRVRSTLDLYPARHRALKRWCLDAADELGEAEVSKQDVLDALVGRLLTDETLSRKIIADLRVRQ